MVLVTGKIVILLKIVSSILHTHTHTHTHKIIEGSESLIYLALFKIL